MTNTASVTAMWPEVIAGKASLDYLQKLSGGPWGRANESHGEWLGGIVNLSTSRVLGIESLELFSAWGGTAPLTVFPQVPRTQLGVLLSLLGQRTDRPNINEYLGGPTTIEARLNQDEQLFAEVSPGGEVEAVLYVQGRGTVTLEARTVAGLLREVLDRLGGTER